MKEVKITDKIKYKKGWKILKENDWVQCNNKNYFEKNSNYYHWNVILKKWIYN